jgi:hypothetical protein
MSDSGFWEIASKGIGTVIGRRSTSKGREYVRIWIYVPTKVSEDTSFPFKIGDPCEVEIDMTKGQGILLVRKISKEQAMKKGWSRRRRFSSE